MLVKTDQFNIDLLQAKNDSLHIVA